MDDNSKRATDAILIDLWRKGFAEGNKTDLLRVLCICFEGGYDIPTWVKTGMRSALSAVENGSAASWDEVFGPTKPIVRQEKRWNLACKILLEVVDAENAGKAVDTTLFDEIGGRLNVSGGKAREYYYEFFKNRVSSKKHR